MTVCRLGRHPRAFDAVERASRVGVLDDLGFRVAGFLDDRVTVVSLDDRFGLEDLVSVDDREPARKLASLTATRCLLPVSCLTPAQCAPAATGQPRAARG